MSFVKCHLEASVATYRNRNIVLHTLQTFFNVIINQKQTAALVAEVFRMILSNFSLF